MGIRGLPEGARRNEGQAGTNHRAEDGVGPGFPVRLLRFQNAEPSEDRDMDLRDAIQRIAVEWPS
jgi:hypothetical protein